MQPKTILYAEDDSNDAVIFRMACRRAKLPHVLHVVGDGQQAIDWLSGEGDYRDREKFPRPDFLLLDLKMPKRTGFDVLKWVRSAPEYQNLPKIVLSSSDDPDDVTNAYALGATTYFAKTYAYQDVIQYLRRA